MVRHAAAVVLVVVLNPSWLCAQAAELTVNVTSTTVYKAPSTGSIVIGQAARGTVLHARAIILPEGDRRPGQPSLCKVTTRVDRQPVQPGREG